MPKIKIFFICSGLGVINRGYESFTRECFDALKGDNRLDSYLFKGGGNSVDQEIKLFNLPRFSKIGKLIGRILGKDSYTIEQFTFCLSLIPALLSRKPDVILVSDFILSTYLWHIRKFLNLKYKILFSNGAPNGPPFHRCDHVQQLLPIYYQLAVNGGTSPTMMSTIPYGIHIPENTLLDADSKVHLRSILGIPSNAYVILSVGAINDHHKRMSYVIKEFACLQLPNTFLIILGQIENTSKDIIKLANDLLPQKNFIIKSVAYNNIQSYYQCADVFVLASLNEGFGRVFLEALTFGLPIITHDAPIFHQVLGETGCYLNLLEDNALANFLTKEKLEELNIDAKRIEKINYTQNTYSWNALKEKYIEMITKNCE